MKKDTLLFVTADVIVAGTIVAYGVYMDKWREKEMDKVREWMSDNYLVASILETPLEVDGAQDVTNLIFEKMFHAPTKKAFNFWFGYLKEFNQKLIDAYIECIEHNVKDCTHEMHLNAIYATIVAEYWSVIIK